MFQHLDMYTYTYLSKEHSTVHDRMDDDDGVLLYWNWMILASPLFFYTAMLCMCLCPCSRIDSDATLLCYAIALSPSFSLSHSLFLVLSASLCVCFASILIQSACANMQDFILRTCARHVRIQRRYMHTLKHTHTNVHIKSRQISAWRLGVWWCGVKGKTVLYTKFLECFAR